MLVAPELRLQSLSLFLIRFPRRLDPGLVQLGRGVVRRYLLESLDGADIEVGIPPALGLRDGGLERVDAEEGAGPADVEEAVESRAAWGERWVSNSSRREESGLVRRTEAIYPCSSGCTAPSRASAPLDAHVKLAIQACDTAAP